jgi:hypothetical protein
VHSDKRSLMVLLKTLSAVYDSYDRGRTKHLDAEIQARRVLTDISAALQRPVVRDALLQLQQSARGVTTPHGDKWDDFISVELHVTEGFGFTRMDLRRLLDEATRAHPAALPADHPADALDSALRSLHDRQMSALMAAKQLGGRKRKKSAKGVIRKGAAKVTGGVALVVADALLLPVLWSASSFSTGVSNISSGLDDLGG